MILAPFDALNAIFDSLKVFVWWMHFKNMRVASDYRETVKKEGKVQYASLDQSLASVNAFFSHRCSLWQNKKLQK